MTRAFAFVFVGAQYCCAPAWQNSKWTPVRFRIARSFACLNATKNRLACPLIIFPGIED